MRDKDVGKLYNVLRTDIRSCIKYTLKMLSKAMQLINDSYLYCVYFVKALLLLADEP